MCILLPCPPRRMLETLWRCSACWPMRVLFIAGHLMADTSPTTSPSQTFFSGFTQTAPIPGCSLWEWTADWWVHSVKAAGLWIRLGSCDVYMSFCTRAGLNHRWSTTWKTVPLTSFSFWTLSASSKAPCQSAWPGILPSPRSSFFSSPRTNTRWSFSTAPPRRAGLWNKIRLFVAQVICQRKCWRRASMCLNKQEDSPRPNIWLSRQESSGASHV